MLNTSSSNTRSVNDMKGTIVSDELSDGSFQVLLQGEALIASNGKAVTCGVVRLHKHEILDENPQKGKEVRLKVHHPEFDRCVAKAKKQTLFCGNQ